VEYRSRNGKEIQLLGNLDKDFITLAGDVDCVFDGELLVVEGDKILDRQTGNGILNKANKGTISVEEASKVRATIWDVIPYLYFIDGECNTPYGKRFDSLQLLMKKAPSKVFLVQSNEVQNMEEANVLFDRYLSAGLEGIILKDKASIWEDKRSKGQIKFKGELECDLKIVGVEEGTGKYAGMLGAVLLESSDSVIKVRAGSGFSDDQRKTLWGENIVDKIAAIKYNMRIKNKVGEESLFLPIVLEIRDDKTEADSSKDIK
jgi:ATP-dependent DNA ligase